MSRIRADRYTNREGTGAPTFSSGVNVVGVSSVGITTITGIGQTALTVNGDARITGVLTVGQGSVTIGSTNITTQQINNLNFPTAGALSNRNRIINGDLRVWQRGTSATLNNSTSQTVKVADRWNNYHLTDGAVTESQSTDVPTGAGFYYSLKHEVSTADTSIAANQFHCHKYDIEGYDVAHLLWGTSQAKPITVSFWAKSSVVGDYGFCIRPGANSTRFYVDTLTISQANTWKKYSFTVPGCPDGTWEKTTSAGLEVQISHSMGTTYQTSSLRQWTSSAVVSPTSQVNWMGTVGNTWYITGLQVEVGESATPFEHRSYGDELAKCQRYYILYASSTSRPICTGAAYATTRAFGVVHLPVTMRDNPTVIATSGSNNFSFFANGNGGSGFSTLLLQETNTNSVTVETSNTLSVTSGHAGWIRTNVGTLAFSAEI